MSGAIRDPKEVIWVGPLRKDLKSFPRPVQRATGIALYATPKAEIAEGASGKAELIMMQKDESQFEKGSGNVFADLGFADPEKEQLKAHLAFEIHRVLKEKKWTQRKIGEVLGIAQPHVSDLMRAQPTKFSVNRLMGFLMKLDQDIEIRVRPKAGREAQITVQPR